MLCITHLLAVFCVMSHSDTAWLSGPLDLQMVNISLRVLSKPDVEDLSTIFKVPIHLPGPMVPSLQKQSLYPDEPIIEQGSDGCVGVKLAMTICSQFTECSAMHGTLHCTTNSTK